VKGGIAGFSQQRKIFSSSDRKGGAEAPPFPSLTITKLVTVFNVYDSVEAAANSYPQIEPASGAAPAQS
jgi:hypothetical protein